MLSEQLKTVQEELLKSHSEGTGSGWGRRRLTEWSETASSDLVDKLNTISDHIGK